MNKINNTLTDRIPTSYSNFIATSKYIFCPGPRYIFSHRPRPLKDEEKGKGEPNEGDRGSVHFYWKFVFIRKEQNSPLNP
jgi:hypothetical protein